MTENKACGTCVHFYPLQKVKSKGGFIDLPRGYCLGKSVFAKNKPGKPVHPPGAKTEDLPYGRSKTVVVHKDDVVPNCNLYRK